MIKLNRTDIKSTNSMFRNSEEILLFSRPLDSNEDFVSLLIFVPVSVSEISDFVFENDCPLIGTRVVVGLNDNCCSKLATLNSRDGWITIHY